MSPRFRARKRIRLGPIYLIFTEHGFSSWGVQVGPYSRNFTRGSSSFDTPGPGSVQWGGRKAGRR